LEAIEVQESAAPFHDWNERIQAECYAPNGACRIRRDWDGPVAAIVNNYRDLSFNFGPTLLSWMERADPQGYEAILQADRESVEDREGHGNALAQGYNHMILPLASPHDLRTQVFWGQADFTHRFSRKPEGMWLPETAVDMDTLRTLARTGIQFTVLAPKQARAVRKLAPVETAVAPLEASGLPPGPEISSGKKTKAKATPRRRWHDVSGGRVDPSVAYWCDLGEGLGINLFFYDGPISGAVAFDGLLNDGRLLGQRLLGVVREHDDPQLIHIATDGESYGHHHKQGDMALAAAFRYLKDSRQVEVTNYGQFLERFPPEYEVKIVEPSAWSCAHGVGRWSEDCGCNAGTPGFHQRWRAPLRHALDHLKEGLDQILVKEGGRLLQDPWAARDAYIGVLLNPNVCHREQFLGDFACGDVGEQEARDIWRLMEMQRHGMFMYTSCGWFFDELSGIEGIQILRYAARAMELGESLGGELRAEFLENLAEVPSNVSELGNGKKVFLDCVEPSRVGPARILARHAISSVLDEPEERRELFCYDLEQGDFLRESSANASLAVGRVRLTMSPTQDVVWAAYAVIHFGEHDFSCKVHNFSSIEDYDRAKREVFEAFRRHSLKDTILAIEEGFPGSDHDIRDLFSDERRTLVHRVLRGNLDRLASGYERIYRENRKLMSFLSEVGIPVPEELAIAARYVLSRRLDQGAKQVADLTTEEEFNQLLRTVEETLAEARQLKLPVDQDPLERALGLRLEAEVEGLAEEQGKGSLELCLWLVELARSWNLEVRTWRAENSLFRYLTGPVEKLEERVRLGEVGFETEMVLAHQLARSLGFGGELVFAHDLGEELVSPP
jgi:alpha-amylase/alpha-mannosidase (GH57 family)